MKISEVMEKIVSIDCIDLNTGNSRGCGTAFWCALSSGVELITAAHLPWPIKSPLGPIPRVQGEEILVQWKMINGSSGSGKAVFRVNPEYPDSDISIIEFIGSHAGPPQLPFQTSRTLPAISVAVTAVGFPGPFNITSKAVADYEAGIVTKISTNSDAIFVGGTACGGYSGCPAFVYKDENEVCDDIIGMMSGRPYDRSIIEERLSDAYLLVSSCVFP